MKNIKKLIQSLTVCILMLNVLIPVNAEEEITEMDQALPEAVNSENSAEINVAEPWEIPWGQQFDLSASYRFKIGGLNATIYGNVYNLFNYNYVMDAYTNSAQEGRWDNAYRIFYSFGRTYSLKLKVNF